jgi:hypothetical protein
MDLSVTVSAYMDYQSQPIRSATDRTTKNMMLIHVANSSAQVTFVKLVIIDNAFIRTSHNA